MDWIQQYWQLLFVGTISYIGGLAAPTIVKNFNRWIDLKSKIIKYNSLINHSFTEDEYDIYKKLKNKRILTKNEKDILNYMQSNDEIFINIIIREINNNSINHDYINYDESVKCDKNQSFLL